MSKKVAFDVSQSILRGVEIVARAVKSTLGPRGRNVIIEQRNGHPTITKDGVTVAKSIDLEDPYENLGARMLIEASAKTNDVSGDGTTTTVVLAEAIFKDGLKNIVAGVNPVEMQSGIDLAVKKVVEQLRKIAVQVTDKSSIANIATIAANGDAEIGTFLADAVDKVGKDGIITIEESKTTETSIEVVDGTRFSNGFTSAYFMTDPAKSTAVLDNPYILIYEKKLSDLKSVVPLLEKITQQSRPLLIIAEDVDTTILQTLVINKMRGSFQSCVVKAPSFGIFRKDILTDIAVLTGGKAITEDLGIKVDQIQLSDLGQAKKITVTKDDTTIVEGKGSKVDVETRIELIKKQKAVEAQDFNREKLQERLARLAGGVAVISIGATTESELREKKYRVEDALQATEAAIQEGIVPGGGTAFLKCLSELDYFVSTSKLSDDIKAGIKIVRLAITEPLKRIAVNAGKEGTIVFEKVMSEGLGYNARTDSYEDLMESGVVDPVKVTRAALENAASIAALLLTTECAIVDVREKEQKISKDRRVSDE